MGKIIATISLLIGDIARIFCDRMSYRIINALIFPLLGLCLLIGAGGPAAWAGAEAAVCAESCREELACSHAHAYPFRCCVDEDESGNSQVMVRPAAQKRQIQKPCSPSPAFRGTRVPPYLEPHSRSGVPAPSFPNVTLSILRTVVLLN